MIFQKTIGVILLIFSAIAKENMSFRNPEFLWVLFIVGILFILIPDNLFD